MEFNGYDTYVSLDPYSQNLGFGKTDNHTFAAWFKTTLTEHCGVIFASITSACEFPAFHVVFRGGPGYCDSNIEPVHGTDLITYSGNGYNDDYWHHIVVVYNGSGGTPSLELYMDGESVDIDAGDIPGSSASDFGLAKIGVQACDGAPWTHSFEGTLDEIRVYDRALDETEVSALYAQYAPRVCGDVDCNDIVNISDAVYLITYIFGGGPEPCANCP